MTGWINAISTVGLLFAPTLQKPQPFRYEPNKKCLKMVDHSKSAPISLKGRLAVTYFEDSIDSDLHDNHEVGVYDMNQSPPKFTRITNNLTNEAEVEISPDGTKMLYTARTELDDFSNNSEIWQVNMDGTNPVKLASGQPMGVPAWIHPHSDKLMFIKWRPDTASTLLTLDTKTGALTPTPIHRKVKGPADPEVSYDGKLVTFKMVVPGDRENQPSIYVMHADGSKLKRLTWTYSDHDPVFSRDGKKIYFERYYGPGDWFEASQDRTVPEHNWWGIVEVEIKTRKERVIVPHDPCGRHFTWLPTVSPDGKYLMYIHHDMKSETASDLWVSRIDGKYPQKVPGSEGFYFFDWTE